MRYRCSRRYWCLWTCLELKGYCGWVYVLGECVELHVWLGLRSLGIGLVLRWSNETCYIWLTTVIQQLSINLPLPTYALSTESCTLDIKCTVCTEYGLDTLERRRCRSFSTHYLGSTSITSVDGNLPVELLCILCVLIQRQWTASWPCTLDDSFGLSPASPVLSRQSYSQRQAWLTGSTRPIINLSTFIPCVSMRSSIIATKSLPK